MDLIIWKRSAGVSSDATATAYEGRLTDATYGMPSFLIEGTYFRASTGTGMVYRAYSGQGRQWRLIGEPQRSLKLAKAAAEKYAAENR